jgi:signal transduction histidine kinase
MADGVIIVGRDGVIRFANPAAEQLFGRSVTQLVGSEFGFATVAGETTEVDVVRPGGAIVCVELRVVDTDWENEAARLVSLRDVTDRKRAEERAAQLERERMARAEAEAANQAKSEFLAVMSHELRTPLNAVIGYADLLELGIAGPLNPEQRHQVSRIRTSGRHLLGLVNEVLDLSKVEAGRLSLQSTVARAGQTADAALALVQPVAESRGIRFTAKCLGDTDALYEGDEDRVRQVLVNLLNNAVKFTDPGGTVTVECGVTKRPDAEARLAGAPWVYLRVTDTGCGIPRDHLLTIFDPFVQVESGHTRQNDGSGLGLTISRRLARLMKGDLTVRSEVGTGSTFTLWLPAASQAARAKAKLRANSPDVAARLAGLAEIGEALVRELEPLLSAFVSRLRGDPLLARAQSLGFAQLADHVGTYVADVGAMLIAVEETSGQPSPLLADGSDIQRLVAERHGAQRARLGWTKNGLQREWRILEEEIERAIRRRMHAVPDATILEALTIVHQFIEQCEEISCRAFVRAQQEASEIVRRRTAPVTETP